MAADKTPSSAPKHTTYPYYSLQKAMELAEVVRDLGGANSEVQRSLIAQRLGMEDNSPSLVGILGAARLYDLIAGRGTYRLTETAMRFFHPTNPNDSRLAQLAMIKAPPLFSALIDRFDGSRLPNIDLLINVLHRDHLISESWRSRAASLFVSALKDAQVLDGAGFLRYKAG
jgi:hypothetical protein